MKDIVRFETGISQNNLRHWGELEAVKEVLQNVVYAKSILGDEIDISWEEGIATIKNSPSGFTKGKLLIGESDQADVEGAPGQYGEGVKVAMAVARRLDLECSIQTNGFSVMPELEPSSLDETVNSLVFYINDNDIHEGTVVNIECSSEILEEAMDYFAVLRGMDPDRTKVDSIMTDFKGIYSNGVKITDMDSLYGYNFTNPELINRDRTTVDYDQVRSETRYLISALEDEEVITNIVENIVLDETLLESQSGMFYTDNTSIWKKVIRKLFGGKIAIATGTESDTKARYRGFNILRSVPRSWTSFFVNELEIVPSNQIQEINLDKNKHNKATPDENRNLGWAKRLVKMYYAEYGTVRVSEKVTDGFGNECAGLYDPVKDEIWIKRNLLSDKEELFKTLLHETIHRETGADDNTIAFTKGWEKASWGILTRGKLDKYE